MARPTPLAGSLAPTSPPDTKSDPRHLSDDDLDAALEAELGPFEEPNEPEPEDNPTRPADNDLIPFNL